MSGVRLTLDDREVQQALGNLLRRLANPRPALEAIGAAVVADTDLAFRGQSDPWGQPWTPLSAVTQARRRQGPGAGANQILRDTGRLANSIGYQVSGDAVSVGTNVVYAAPHQFGNPANRMHNTPRGNQAPIPPRPFLPLRNNQVDLPAALRAEIMAIATRHLAGAV